MRFIKLSENDLKSLQNGQRYGKHFLFRDRCQCLILSHQGYSISQLTEMFKTHRVTIYERFNLWESGGIQALHKKPGQGRRPKLSPANPKHIERARALVENERQNLKTVVAQLSAELNIEMHPDTLKRFLKNLAILSEDSANASRRVRTRVSTMKAK
ncbi:MAG: helix-turn-helix domain-containing protein [Acidobacteria bacterium]|nr:helix-turn-helix domain-containing protein [Acidobacteriota bacterium]